MERNTFTAEQEKWLRALESGEWKQVKRALKRDGKFCCLGVACELGLADGYMNNSLTKEGAAGLGLRDQCGKITSVILAPNGFRCDALTDLNDEAEWTFAQISAFIRANPWQVFTNFDVPTGAA